MTSVARDLCVEIPRVSAGATGDSLAEISPMNVRYGRRPFDMRSFRELGLGIDWSLSITVVILNAGRRGQSGGELDAARVVYCAYVGDVAVRTDKH
jgi:hypothetical protein